MSTLSESDWSRVARYLARDYAPDEAVVVEQWISATPERAAEVARVRRVWDAERQDGQGREWPSAEMWKSVDAAITPTHNYRSLPQGTPQSTSRTTPQHTQRRMPRHTWANNNIRAFATVMAMLVVSFVAYVAFDGVGEHSRRQATVTRQTGAGERLRVTLPDGSTVTLAPRSRITFAHRFGTSSNRTVTLDGQALFTVTHAAGVPFVVQTGAVATRVLGTSFAIRRYATDTTTQLVVAEGRIAVGSAVFGTGDIAMVNGNTPIMVSRGNSVAEQLAWTEGRLVFSGIPLREAIPVLERWYGLTVTVADSALLDRRVTTTLGPESPERAVDLVAFVVEGRAELRGSHVVIHSN